MINFVQDQVGATTYKVETKGLWPVVAGTTYNQTAITSLPGSPWISSNSGTTVESDTATITHNQTSATTYNVTSDVNVTGEFTYSTIGWGYFNASNVFVGTAANLGNSVTLALNGTAGQELKVEFVSKANPNTKKVFYVTLAATHQNFVFDITGLGLVAMINLVQEQVGAANYTVETKGLFYMPVVAGTTYSQAAITSLPGTPQVSSNHGSTVESDTATITHTQLSPTTFTATSQVNVAGEYTYSTIGWGYFDEEGTFVGTGATLPNSVVLALDGTAGRTLKVEFVSTSNPNNKKTFVVTLSATHKNYAFNLTGFGTVGMINFVQDQVGATTYKVETKGLGT
jgi:hypothetical protein